LRTVIQACGRVVRNPDDYGATYLADTSLLELFERTQTATPPWFAEQIDRMSSPDLPEFDPSAALRGESSWERRPDRGQSSERTTSSTADTTAGRSGQTTGSASRGSASTTGSSSSETSATREEGQTSQRSDHPLNDVWGE
jgi:hypothetical protein